jgi:RNA-binding protein
MPEPNNNSMQDLKPTVWIGKQGCTGTMIEEIVAQLKKRKLIKVKWLQNTEVDPEAVASQAKARLVEVRGRTMVLSEKGRAPGSPAPAAKGPVKVTAKAEARAAVGAPARKTSRAPSRSSEKPRARAPGNAASTSSTRAPARSSSRSPARTTSKAVGRSPVKAPSRDARSSKPRRTGSMGRAKK